MFVGRVKELARLRTLADVVRHGENSFIIIEGSAGIGKTSLLEKLKEELGDFQIYESRGDVGSQYIPYSLFTKAFDVENIVDIPKKEEYRMAKKIGEKLKGKKAFALVDEPSGTFSRKILEEIGGGLIISSLRNDGVFITELDVENGIKPYEIDSKILDKLVNYIREEKEPRVLIENINYLIYSLGLEKVLMFLRDIYSANRGTIIVSGDFRSCKEENFKKLSSLFTHVYRFRFSEKGEKNLIFTPTLPHGVVLFSENKGGDYWISESSELRPSMPHFALLDKIMKELKERDIGLDCMRSLIDYNSLEEIYVWLKYIGDVAMLHGRKVYVSTSSMTPSELVFFSSLGEIKEEGEDIQMSQYKIYESFLEFLENLAKEKRVAIIMEDIQWADSNSMEMLNYIARSMPKGVLFIISYRGEEIALTRKAKIIRDMFDYENTEIIRLGPLKREDAEELMDSLGIEKKDEAYKKTGGHPLLIKELAKFSGEKFIPDTVAESIEYQLSKLDDTTLYYLRFLSAMGMEIDEREAKEILGDKWKKEMSGYEDFIEIGEMIRFKGAMIWEQIYGNIAPDLKVKFHKKLGEYYSNRSPFKAAYHYYMSKKRIAIEYLKRAAESAVGMYALENAIDFYKKALEIAEKFDIKEEIVDILEKVGDLEKITGRYREALEDFKKILEIREDARIFWKIAAIQVDLGEYDSARKNLEMAQKEGDEEIRERIKETLGTLSIRQGRLDDAEKYYEEFLKFAKRTGEKREIANAYANLASLRFHQSRYKEGLEYAKMAMENAKESSSYKILISTYNILGIIYDVLGKPQEALEKYQKMYELAKKAGDLRGMAFAYNNIGILYYSIGNLQMVKEYLEKAMELHLKTGDMRNVATSYYNLGGLYADLGNYKKSIEYIQKAIKIYNRLNDYQFAASAEIWLGVYKMRMGDYDEAMKHITKALNIAKKNNYIKVRMMGIVGIARIFTKMGKYEEALKILKSEEELVEKMKSDMDAYPEYLITLCETIVLSSMYSSAENCLEELKKLSDESGDKEIAGNYHLFLAILKDKNGETGEEEFKKAIEEIKEGGYVSSVVDSYYRYGKVLMELNDPRGKEYLKKAKNMYLKMGLDKIVKEIDELCGDC